MIPVTEKPEPSSFETAVRRPGQDWLTANGIPFDGPKPRKIKLKPFWTACSTHLHTEYDGICAYLCVHIEPVLGAATVDHFVAKSPKPGLAYEWSNYRLACLGKNREKGVESVLDPFDLEPDTFRLELITGRIFPNDALSPPARALALRTIDKLALDDTATRALRARQFAEYLAIRGDRRNPELEKWLKRYSPFIWNEAQRQGLL